MAPFEKFLKVHAKLVKSINLYVPQQMKIIIKLLAASDLSLKRARLAFGYLSKDGLDLEDIKLIYSIPVSEVFVIDRHTPRELIEEAKANISDKKCVLVLID